MSGKKYGFVGLDRTTGDITTFHIKNISELIKKAEYLLGLVDECSHNFMEKYDIDEYIIDYEDGMDKEVLKCLAYINMNNIEEAKKIAQESINNGNRGNYENGGKAFFDWILML